MVLCRVVKLWKEEVAKTSQKASDALADPEGYENLFPDFKDTLKAEQVPRLQQCVCVYVCSCAHTTSTGCMLCCRCPLQVAQSGGKKLPPMHSSPAAEVSVVGSSCRCAQGTGLSSNHRVQARDSPSWTGRKKRAGSWRRGRR